MARICPIEPTQADAELAALFAGPLQGQHFNVAKALAASTAALRAITSAQHALHDSTLSPVQRVAVRLVVSQHAGSVYDLAHAGHDAKSLGLSNEQITSIRRGSQVRAELEPLVSFARALLDKRGRTSDEDVARARAAGMDDRTITALIALVGLTWTVCLFNVFNSTPPDFPPLADV